jgi:uncharacterized damage-inducible protein DinB
VTYLRRLADHLAWADGQVCAALRAAPRADPGWLELYAHVVAAEHLWLRRIAGRAAEVAVWPALDLDGCARLGEANVRELGALLDTLAPADLGRGVAYVNSAGQSFENTVEDILLHVALHGAYHRGQIAAAMRRGGAEPAPTDYIAFIRGAPAATRVER